MQFMPMTAAVQTVRDQVVSRLRSELLGGRYEPGTPLREEALAERFGVSRMPVRNALQELVHEGLLVAKRNCGVTVAAPPSDLVINLLTPLRVQIETYALRLCLPGMTAPRYDGLTAILDEMAAACARRDDAAVIVSDFAFHQFLLTAAGLDDIVPVWKGVVGKMKHFHMARNRTHADYGVIWFVHSRLLEVFRAGDVDAAIGALASHIEGGVFNQRAVETYHASRR
jgi:DNA-binding GntR family transcriptional regulator